jgi:hypothetical protein
MSDRDPKPIAIDPVTAALVILGFLFVPLILIGLVAH